MFREAMAGMMMLLSVSSANAQTIDWQSYKDGTMAISLPMGLFARLEDTDGESASYFSEETNASLRLAGGPIPGNVNFSQMTQRIEGAEDVSKVTYRAGGRRWFVMSGYTSDDQIFYAKFLANRTFTHFAFFQITYPIHQKQFFDPVVTKIEKSLRVF
jgi:hypothetical protein